MDMKDESEKSPKWRLEFSPELELTLPLKDAKLINQLKLGNRTKLTITGKIIGLESKTEHGIRISCLKVGDYRVTASAEKNTFSDMLEDDETSDG